MASKLHLRMCLFVVLEAQIGVHIVELDVR
jgi:hypothetical protein